MKKQIFHDATAGVLIGLILSIIFSLIYAPNTYAPLNPYSIIGQVMAQHQVCLLYTSPSPRDSTSSRMPSSA